jgi:nitrous-oxide reductase
MLFASGGHSGQVHVIGLPSMRLLKTIAVFTPEPWQGYGYGADWSEASLADTGGPNFKGNGGGIVDPTGNGPKDPLRWGDSHHPA